VNVDYQSLYVQDYFGHQEGAASFPAQFPEVFAGLVREVGGGAVLDVGAGNNELIRRLRGFGLDGFSLDLRGDEARSVLSFDLTKFDADLCASVQGRVAEAHPGGPHVTCCLDVLEHLDRNDMATAIWNLRELSVEWLLLSVSTRPSSRYNLFHATIMPKRSWRSLVQAAGFEVTDHASIADLASRRDYPDDENCWSVNQWRRVDPFRDAFDPESFYLLLRRRPEPVDKLEFEATAARLLGRGGHAAEPPSLRDGTHLVFLLGHYQDFLQYIPFWDILPAARFTVLWPGDPFGVVGHRRVKAIEAWMKGRGIRVRHVASTGELDWGSLPGPRRALIASSDSTASASHLFCSAFVLEARAQGVATFQIQHGIWPRASFPHPIRFYAATILSWSDEYRDGFPRAAADIGPSQGAFVVTGCAKFDDYAGPSRLDLADLLGEWVEPYSKRVRVATNLHWPLHHLGSEVMPRLYDTARAMPDTLFVCKLHPVHDLDDAAIGDRPKNLLLLDEFACLFAGLTTSQLVRACDAVVCTRSTVALEAALANRPLVVLETQNPNRYEGVEPVAIADMESEVRRILAMDASRGSGHFRDHYYDTARLGHALERVLGVIEETLDRGVIDPQPIDPAALRVFASTFADYILAVQPGRLSTLHHEALRAKAEAADLSSRLARAETAHALAAASAAEVEAVLRADRNQAAIEAESLRSRLATRVDPAEPTPSRGPRLASVLRSLFGRR